MTINGVGIKFDLNKIADFKRFRSAQSRYAEAIKDKLGSQEPLFDETTYNAATEMFADLFGDEVAAKIMRTNEEPTISAYYTALGEFTSAVKQQQDEIVALKEKFNISAIKK